jgi:hypothetical protein
MTADLIQIRHVQPVAMTRAEQICRIRSGLRQPRREVRMVKATFSTESRLTAVSRDTGSWPGSSSTSLSRPRSVVVHGAIKERRSRGIVMLRDSITTGRRPISGISQHHNSPLCGQVVTKLRHHDGTKQGPPIRRAHRADGLHTLRCKPDRSRVSDGPRPASVTLHRESSHRMQVPSALALARAVHGQLLC